MTDALFPILPRWYTDPLRAHARTLSTAAPGSVQQRLSYPPCTDRNHLSHEHEMLEMLYDDVWSNRFINPTPSSIIPGYFGAIFDRVQAPPVVNMLPPPLAPFAPLPGIRNPPARPSFAVAVTRSSALNADFSKRRRQNQRDPMHRRILEHARLLAQRGRALCFTVQ